MKYSARVSYFPPLKKAHDFIHVFLSVYVRFLTSMQECLCVCMFSRAPTALSPAAFKRIPSLKWYISVETYFILPGQKKLLIVVSCSGKLHSVSLQLRGQAANSRAPS